MKKPARGGAGGGVDKETVSHRELLALERCLDLCRHHDVDRFINPLYCAACAAPFTRSRRVGAFAIGDFRLGRFAYLICQRCAARLDRDPDRITARVEKRVSTAWPVEHLAQLARDGSA